MKKRAFIYYGDPILRQKTRRVEGIDEGLRQLIEEMKQRLIEKKGAGLAAPQVGESISLFITRDYSDPQADWQRFPNYRVYINPKILSVSDEKWTHAEGCLSLPGLRAEVVRPLVVEIEATDSEGKRFQERLEGWPARVILHENDHLNGVLFIDRLNVQDKKRLEPMLKSLKKKPQQDQ